LEEEDFPPQLVRRTLDEYLTSGKIISPFSPVPKRFIGKAGVFVSLHKKGKLRGCIGTYLPTQPSVASEIIKNAISAAVQDPRFPPVRLKELADIKISVDILSPLEVVHSKEELDPRKYGVIVSRDYQRGLLLPDLKGVDTVKEQLEIVKQKAGLEGFLDEDLGIQRFTVTRYQEG